MWEPTETRVATPTLFIVCTQVIQAQALNTRNTQIRVPRGGNYKKYFAKNVFRLCF